MKRLINFLLILTFGLFSCNPQIDLKKIVPSHVDKFATEFVTQIQNGNIDSCLTLVHPEMNNENGRQFLTNTHNSILTFNLDSFRIINSRKINMVGDNSFTNYGI